MTHTPSTPEARWNREGSMPLLSDEYLTADEIANGLRKFGPATIRLWAREGRLPHLRVGGKILFRRADVEAFLRQAMRPATRGTDVVTTM